MMPLRDFSKEYECYHLQISLFRLTSLKGLEFFVGELFGGGIFLLLSFGWFDFFFLHFDLIHIN